MGWRALIVLLAGCGRLGFDDGGAPCRAVDNACSDGFTCVDQLCVLAPDAGGETDAATPPGDAPPLDPSGTFTLNAPVVYSCALGLVDISVSSFAFASAGVTLTATSNDPGVPQQPCKMTGALGGADFDVTCTLAGGCNEVYRLAGAFTGPDTWSATFSATFTGQCLNCTLQAFPLTGTR